MTGKIRVVIPTTEGPSTVLRVTAEDPSLRSVVCLGRSTTLLPISPAYDAFVRAPTGVVERAVGHPAFRVDVSAPIDDGQSWQLGLYVAHRLKAAGRLAEDGAPAELVLWATGAVDGDLAVLPVEGIEAKLRRSAALFESTGEPVLVAVPAARAGLPADLPGGVRGVAVGTAPELVHRLIGAAPAAGRRRPLARLAVAGLAAAAAAAAAVVLLAFPPTFPTGTVPPTPPPPSAPVAPAFDPAAFSLAVLEIRPADGEACGAGDRAVAVDPGQETAPGVCAVAAKVSNGGPAAGFVWLVLLAEGAFREYSGNARSVETAVGPLAPGEAAEVRVAAPAWMRRPVVFRVLLMAGAQEDAQVSRALAGVDMMSTEDLDRLTGQALDLGLEVRTVRHRVQPRP